MTRVAVVRGVLDDAVRSNKRGGGALVQVYSDGNVYPVIAPPSLHVAGLGGLGDPPGSWRGSRFTMTGPAIVNTEPDDNLDQLTEALAGLEVHFLPTGPRATGDSPASCVGTPSPAAPTTPGGRIP